jgi:hypothetical protein
LTFYMVCTQREHNVSPSGSGLFFRYFIHVSMKKATMNFRKFVFSFLEYYTMHKVHETSSFNYNLAIFLVTVFLNSFLKQLTQI